MSDGCLSGGSNPNLSHQINSSAVFCTNRMYRNTGSAGNPRLMVVRILRQECVSSVRRATTRHDSRNPLTNST